MHYLALLLGAEPAETSEEEFAAEIARYEKFEAANADPISWGAALYPTPEALTVRTAGGESLISDGPFAELAEVVGGVYVFEADDLDAVLQVVRQIPAAEDGQVEVWPMVEWQMAANDGSANRWLALLRNPGGGIPHGTPEWDAGAAEHEKFAAAVGEAIRGGGALHPPSAATTVRSRNGELLLTDGPYAETNEIVNGLYVLAAGSPDEAGKIAAQIPMGSEGCVELRQIVDLGG
jgi:hypothetical protein